MTPFAKLLRGLRVALVVAGALSGPLEASIPHSVPIHADVTNGKVDTQHLRADSVTPISFPIGGIPDQSTTNATYSVNVRSAYLTEPSGAGTVLTVTGCTLPGGWTFVADVLAHSGSSTGTATCTITATLGTFVLPSNSFLVSYTGADALAPTIPVNLVGTPTTGGIDWTWDGASDPNDGTNNGSGVKEYDLELNGVVTVVADTSAGLTTASTGFNIGAISPTPTATQSGTQWTLGAAGTGIDGTADQLYMRGTSVTGNFCASGKVSSITNTGGNIYAPAGIIARDTTVVGAPYVADYEWASAQSQGVQGKYRATLDGAKTTLAFVPGTNSARWLRECRTNAATTGETWRLQYSSDGTTFSAIDSPTTLQLSSTLTVGPFLSSMVGGVANSAVIQNFSISQRTLTYHQTTTSSTTARIRARDRAGTPNVSAYSALTPSVVPLVSAVVAKKWHPGQGVMLPDHNTFSSSYFTSINTAPAIVNVEQLYDLGKLESTKGTFTLAGPIALANAAKAIGRNFVFQIWDTSFSDSGGTSHLPAYYATETGGGGGWFHKPSGGYKAKNWLKPIADREIAVMQALCAQFDTDPYFEGIVTAESDPADVKTSPDWDEVEYSKQLIRIAAATVAACPHSNVWISENFVPTGGVAAMNLLANTVAAGAAYTGPDVMTGNSDNSTNTDRAARGLQYVSGAWIAGGHDYRGEIAIGHDVQGPELGGKEGGFTMTQLYNQSFNVNKDAHVFWLYKTTSRSPDPPADLFWSTDILPFLQAGGHPTRTACPTGPPYSSTNCYTLH